MNYLFILVVIFIICFGYRDDKIRERNCSLISHGKPFTEESYFGTTEDGCKITLFTKFNASCDSEGYVYVTNCDATAWDHKSGKTVRRESNVTKKNRDIL